MKDLMGHTLKEYGDILASDTPTPGGGSTAALAGAYGAALGAMVAALTYGKKDWEAIEPNLQETFKKAHEELLLLKSSLERQVDADTAAFNVFLSAKKMPRENADQELARKTALGIASVRILTVPLNTAEQCLSVLNHLQDIATCGNRNALSDVGTGAALALAGLEGALMNVRVNLPGIPSSKQRADLMEQAERMWEQGCEVKEQIMTALFIRMSA